MSFMHKVVVVGRTNVGKSSLFNMIAPTVKSLVLDLEGVTRDMVSDTVTWNGFSFELVDTGGIELGKKVDVITAAVADRVLKVIDQASLILFVVDGQTGITDKDLQVKKIVQQANKKTIVLVNKVDTAHQAEMVNDFYGLGFDHIVAVSASHNRNIADLLDSVVDQLRQTSVTEKMIVEKPEFKVALLGRPNAGKSSLMNLLVKQEFSIVSDIAGTTREALRKKIMVNKNVIELIDTAGVRKKSGIDSDLESMMVTNSLQAAKRAHVVLMVIDVTEPELTAQELKLACYAFENGAAVIIIMNKHDLLDEYGKSRLESSMLEYKYILDKIEIMHISCKTGKNVGKILPLIQEVWNRFNTKITDRELTDICVAGIAKVPLYKNGQQIYLHKAKQIGNAPMRIELIVRNAVIFEESHKSFFENVIRKNVSLKSVPMFLYEKTKPKNKS